MHRLGRPRARHATILIVACLVTVSVNQLPATAAMPPRLRVHPIEADFQPGGGIDDHGIVPGTMGVNGAHLATYDVRHHTATDLGAIGGFTSLTVNGINRKGVIVGVGNALIGTSVVADAFSYDTASHTFADLNALFGGDFSVATTINDQGLVGGAKLTRSDRGYHGVVVDPATGTVTAVPGLPGDPQSTVIDINNRGVAVGSSWMTGPAFAAGHGFVTDLATHRTAAIPAGGRIGSTVPIAVNDAGLAVGPVGQFHGDDAFVYDTTSATLTDLGTLPGDDGSSASAVNRQGQIVGASFGGSSQPRAFIWTPRTRRLTPIGPDTAASRAEIWGPTGINRHGLIVGTTLPPGGPPFHMGGFVARVSPTA